MPELPEVETIRRGLSKYILHKKFKKLFFSNDLNQKNVIPLVNGRDIHFFDSNLNNVQFKKNNFLNFDNTQSFKANNSENFPDLQCGKCDFLVIGLRRFGKALIVDLEGGVSMMIHLRMTGQLIWRGEENYAAGHPSENFTAELPNKQTRVIFEFEDGKLFFNDQRKFGFVKILKTEDVEKEEFIRKLAKEPWEMSGEEFYEKLQRHKNAVIKAVILDQTVICGLGNIYADESLFYAGVHPERRAGSLSREEAEKILEGARNVMQESIDSGGSTMATYVKADGTRGDYLEKFAKVFRREGKKCLRCGAEIVKIRVAGRGTHICPNCQRKEKDA